MSESSHPMHPVIGIVGSAGQFGRWWTQLLHQRLGLTVLGSDPADPDGLAPSELIERCDVLIFSAPIRYTVGLIEQYAALAGTRAQAQLWMDLTSIKTAPIAAMLRSGAEVVGLHPMTAPPKAPTLRGRVMVVCEARLQRWRPWLQSLLDASEADCVAMEAEHHDARMARVQNMVHLLHLAQAGALAQTGTGEHALADLMACRTVGFETDLATTARMLAADPRLYIDILRANAEAPRVIELLVEQLQSMRELLDAGDVDALIQHHFVPAQHWFGQNALRAGNYAFERIGYLLADLNDRHSLNVHIPLDRPGALRALLSVFEELQINLASVHSSRSPQGEVQFRFGLSRDTSNGLREAAAAAIEERELGQIVAG